MNEEGLIADALRVQTTTNRRVNRSLHSLDLTNEALTRTQACMIASAAALFTTAQKLVRERGGTLVSARSREAAIMGLVSSAQQT